MHNKQNKQNKQNQSLNTKLIKALPKVILRLRRELCIKTFRPTTFPPFGLIGWVYIPKTNNQHKQQQYQIQKENEKRKKERRKERERERRKDRKTERQKDRKKERKKERKYLYIYVIACY